MPPTIDSQMRDSDAFSWYMEDDPLMRSTIVAVALLDRKPDWDRLVERLERVSRQLPQFRQRVVSMPLPFRLVTPRWELDPDFDLAWHLRRVEAPPPHDLGAVVELARTAGMTAFDRARPLWEFTVVEGLKGGQAALVMKIHHSLTDGVGGMQMALLLFDTQREALDLGPLPDAPVAEPFDQRARARAGVLFEARRVGEFTVRQVRHALPGAVHVLRDPRAALAGALATAQSIWRMVAPVEETLSPVMQERRLGWRYDLLDVPLADLKRAARSAGCTLNDAFMAGVTGGLRRYHERHGTTVDELRVTLPINIRSEDDPMGGNRITLLRFKLPVGLADPAARMRALHDLIVDVRHEPSIPYTNVVAAALNLLPTAYVGGMIKHVDFVASDVPAFAFPVFLAGAEVVRYQAFGPTIGTALNTTLLSYRGTCHIGVTTDVGAVPDADVLAACLVEGFEEVLAFGGDHEPPSRPLAVVRHRPPTRRREAVGAAAGSRGGEK